MMQASSASATPPPVPAGLVYVSDEQMKGLTRVRRGKAFSYRDARGRTMKDRGEIDRIKRLAIPPAYTDVWICPLANGHIQATARDARGRKQYRYHPSWREHRDDTKFERLEAFGRALPRIRARVARDLAQAKENPVARTTVLATLVRLLDTTLVRVGNEEYARENGSYGLTTLRNPHAGVRGSVLRLRFRGKSGVQHQVELDDKRVALVVRRCQELPGQELFQYQDDDGTTHTLDSGDVNDYLRDAAGDGFTAKDFRTWHASVLALDWTRQACADGGCGFSIKQLLAEVSGQLRNTPAVCRKAYIHPSVLALGPSMAADADAAAKLLAAPSKRVKRGLRAAESRLLDFLANA